MSTPRPRASAWKESGRGVAAAVVLAATVFGIPMVLWELAGNPLPAGIPTWTELSDALTKGDVGDATLVKALALVCWAAWLLLGVTVVVEVGAALRGRSAPSIPGSRWIQGGIAVLVATAAVSLPGTRPAGRPVPPREAVFTEPADETDVLAAASAGRDGDAAPLAGRRATGTDDGPVHVVERRDSLWRIAERRLGDPFRWPEILELNRGKQQPDGHRLSGPDDPLRPGWVLLLPADAPDAEGPIVVVPGDTLWDLSGRHLGDPFRWPELYEANQGHLQADGRRLDDPDLIHPGWALEVPGDGQTGQAAPSPEPDSERAAREALEMLERVREQAEADLRSLDEEASAEAPPAVASGGDAAGSPDAVPGAQQAPGAPTPPAPPDGPAGTEALPEAELPAAPAPTPLPHAETWPEPPADLGWPEAPPLSGLPGADTPGDVPSPTIDLGDAEPLADAEEVPASHDGRALAAAFAGGGLLAAGLTLAVNRLRAAQERWRSPGRRITMPDPVTSRVEATIRAAADPESADFLDAALRAFAARLREDGRVPPGVIGLNLAEALSILFAAPNPDPVTGFTLEDDGYSWAVRRDAARELLATECEAVPPPLPALVTLGRTSDSRVLVNLEAAPTIALTGARLHVQEMLFMVAAELATGRWSGTAHVVCVGFGHELAPLDRVQVVDSLTGVLPALEHGGRETRRLLDEHGLGSTLEARVAGTALDTWAPTVVLCSQAAGEESEVARLVACAGESPGLAALVAGDVPEAAWRVEVGADEVALEPIGVTLARHRITPEERAAIGALLRTTTETEGSAPPGHAPERPVAATARARAAPVEVRVLGPVEVGGGAMAFPRRKALELVVHLACHRQGVEPDVLMEALWPGRLASPSTLHSVTSLARRCLGADEEGQPYLPHVAPDGRYRLHPAVGLDYQRFSAHVERARGLGGDEAVAELRETLQRVRGRPFSGTGIEYLWAHGEALISAVTAEVADAAHDLATRYLDAGDARGAWWATQQGLLASPGNEQLHRDRMLAADLTGNPAAVEEVMSELCRGIEIDGDEMHDVLHPQTVELYERLARRQGMRTALAGR